MRWPKRTRLEWLMSYVYMEPMSGCWLWMGCLSIYGYGHTGHGHAHRVSWVEHRGAIPGDLCVLHKCDVRCCVNPDHLFLGTKTDNAADRERKGRSTKGTGLPQSKLTPEIVREIRDSYGRGGVTQEALGKRFGVGQNAIWKVIRRVNWAHV